MRYFSTTETTAALIGHIESKIPNIYLRFGDGDFNLMDGRRDMLAAPSREIQSAYVETWKRLNNKHMIAVNYHCKELDTLEDGMFPGVHECPHSYAIQCTERVVANIPELSMLYSAVALHHVLTKNISLYKSFIESIRKNGSTIILCNQNFSSETLTQFFGKNIKIGAPSHNSFSERYRIWCEFDAALSACDKFTVCILALGCGGRAMTYKLIDMIQHHSSNIILIDIGSSIDVLMGLNNTRAWVELTKPDIHSLLS